MKNYLIKGKLPSRKEINVRDGLYEILAYASHPGIVEDERGLKKKKLMSSYAQRFKDTPTEQVVAIAVKATRVSSRDQCALFDAVSKMAKARDVEKQQVFSFAR